MPPSCSRALSLLLLVLLSVLFQSAVLATDEDPSPLYPYPFPFPFPYPLSSEENSVDANEAKRCAYPFCADGANCAHKRCKGCFFNCHRAETPATCIDNSNTCGFECTPDQVNRPQCQDCVFLNSNSNSKLCPLGTFRDITAAVYSGEDSDYWLDWNRPGKPAQYFSSPVMTDIDGDGVLDFFSSMHGGDRLHENGTNARIVMGYIILNHTHGNNIVTSGDGNVTNGTNPYPMHLREASSRIIVEDPANETGGYGYGMDKHGEIVADLDNDGILDVFFVSGGMKGGGSDVDEIRIASRDNFLLFGEKGSDQLFDDDDDDDGNVTIFRGGRKLAKQAGVDGRWGRGRFPYLLDVNQDGLLDFFISQPRRADNELAPGILYINQGNRTWREDTSMVEFADAMILTDADGDSVAEEIMMIRGFCFPRRRNPNRDDTFGPFPEEIKEFCSTRPIGSIAIFKFNHTSQRMDEISPNFHDISVDPSMQPECCPHGMGDSYDMGCSAVSMASADFDGDKRPDHVILYKTRMDFFFSSDRPVGELPIMKKYIGLTIDLHPMCTYARAIHLVDMDNSGTLDIIVTCKNTGTFLIYSQVGRKGKEKTKTSWQLHDHCHDNGSLGDIVFSTFEVSEEDLEDSCVRQKDLPKLGRVCKDYRKGNMKPPQQNGATFADINNDGFTDLVIGNNFGYQKFFLYEPSPQSRDNKHISFKLMGDGNDVNFYGIGARLTLYTENHANGVRVDVGENDLLLQRQIREISSYQHISSKGGHKDEKVTFGLGTDYTPVKLVTKWPNGVRQIVHLTKFNTDAVSVSASASVSFSHPFIEVRYPDLTSSGYFRIRNKKKLTSSDHDDYDNDGGGGTNEGGSLSLCLQATRMGSEQRKRIIFSKCVDDRKVIEEQIFSFDLTGRLRSRLFPRHCIAMKGPTNMLFLVQCKLKAARLNSWHLTHDGFIRLSGSNMVMGGTEDDDDGIIGIRDRPYLVEMSKGREDQQWVLDKIHP